MAISEAAEFTVPWPLDQVDLDASIVGVVPSDQGGVDQHRSASITNHYSHGAVFNAPMAIDPRDGLPIPDLAAPEWIDATSIRASVVPAPFHDGSILTAHDMVFNFDRKGGLAEYHQGGETSDHPGGWAPGTPTGPAPGTGSGTRPWTTARGRSSCRRSIRPTSSSTWPRPWRSASCRKRTWSGAATPRWIRRRWAPAPTASSATKTTRTSSSSASRTSSARSTTPSWCRTTPTTNT